MINVDSRLKALYKADSTDKNIALDFYHPGQGEPFLHLLGGSIESETMELNESLSSGENIDFGSCEASEIKVTLLHVEDIVKGSRMVAYQVLDGIFPEEGFYPSETVYPGGYLMPLGTYIVQTAKKQSNRRFMDITALDQMSLFDVNVIAWYNALNFPLTLRNFRASLCRYIGVTEMVPDYLPNDGMMVEKTIDAAQLMGRDVLIACEQANGAFGHFDRNGVLRHVVLQPNLGLFPDSNLYPAEDVFPMLPGDMNGELYDEMLEPYLMKSAWFEEYTVQSIDKVQIRQEEGDIGAIYGSGTNCYTVEGNFLLFGKSAEELQQAAVGIYGMVNNRAYIPFSAETKGLPYIETGDAVRFEFINEHIVSYIMKRTLKGIFALSDSYSATGEEYRGDVSGINSEIIQLKGKAAILKKNVDEVSANLIDLEKNTEAKFKITAEEIAAEAKRAGDAEAALSLRADQITTSVTNLKNSTNSRITQLADQIELRVSKDDLISSINLGLTETGSVITMNAGHFEFKGQNFYVNLDGSGGAANGNFTWDKDGKISIKGADINGALFANINSASTISCNTLGCVYADIDRGHWDDLSFGDAGGNTVTAERFYGDLVGEIVFGSDARLKQSVLDIDRESAERMIRELRPVSFTYKESGRASMGFIAQEVKDICNRHGITLPLYDNLDNSKKDSLDGGTYVIPYINYIPLIVSVVQRLLNDVEELKHVCNQ